VGAKEQHEHDKQEQQDERIDKCASRDAQHEQDNDEQQQ
jgi:hypothetical protein